MSHVILFIYADQAAGILYLFSCGVWGGMGLKEESLVYV